MWGVFAMLEMMLVVEFGALEETQCLGGELFLARSPFPTLPQQVFLPGSPHSSSLRGCFVLGTANYACTFLFDDEGGGMLDSLSQDPTLANIPTSLRIMIKSP